MTAEEQARAREQEARDQLVYERLVAHRDKHLSQLMEINGKAALAVLTAVFAVLVGASKAQGVLPDAPARYVIVIVTLIAIGLLARGAFLISKFHTTRIRSIQGRLRDSQLQLKGTDLEVIPDSIAANSCIFIGLLLLALVALYVFYGVAIQPAPPHP